MSTSTVSLIEKSTLQNIADAIRTKDGSSDPILVSNFATKIQNIPSGGGGDDLLTKRLDGTLTTVNNSVALVCSYALAVSPNLTTVNLPQASILGYYAFGNCYSLNTVSVPECTTVESMCFYQTALTSIYGPKISFIGSSAFNGDTDLTKIDFPNCSIVHQSAFYGCTLLSDINIPNCITVSADAFVQCSIINLDLPNCTTIGTNAFYGNVLSSISLPKCLAIKAYTFANGLLSSISLPACTLLQSSAFAQCSKLETVYLPICSNISRSAFAQCSKLTSIYLLSTSVVKLASAFSLTFTNSPMISTTYTGNYGSIYVPESLLTTYQSATYWSNYSDRITAYTES